MSSLLEMLSEVDDPRQTGKCRYKFTEILFMGACAMLAGADDWEGITLFAKAHEPWFRKHLTLNHGIPSHDTFNRAFSILAPEQFRSLFIKWMKERMKEMPALSGTVAIDGKTVKGSAWTKGKDAIHMVNAWSSELGISLGQCKVTEKSNEITVIPELLSMLELSGCLVTIDAMGCQRAIAHKIVSKKADYLLAVKGNQGNLHNEIVEHFEQHWRDIDVDIVGDNFSDQITENHGRNDRRRCWVAHPDQLKEASAWGAKTISVVQLDSQRGKGSGTMHRYFISSRHMSAAEVLRATREHWHVENSLHWVLDVAFNEDHCRARAKFAAENLATMRQLLLNLLKAEKTCKSGIANKRRLCGWDSDYMLKVLGNIA